MKIKKGIIIFAVIVLILYIGAKSFCFYAYSKRIIQNEDQILELQKNIETEKIELTEEQEKEALTFIVKINQKILFLMKDLKSKMNLKN